MKKLIEILQILSKYTDDIYAEHDILLFGEPESLEISVEDQVQLEELGIFYDEYYDSLCYFV